MSEEMAFYSQCVEEDQMIVDGYVPHASFVIVKENIAIITWDYRRRAVAGIGIPIILIDIWSLEVKLIV